MELLYVGKWTYHQISYCGCYAVHNIITSPSPIFSCSRKKCHYLMPSFLTTELVKFNAEFCDIDLETPAFEFYILFLEEFVSRVDFDSVCHGKYLWLSLSLTWIISFLSLCKNRPVFQTFSPVRLQRCKCEQCAEHLCMCESQSLEAEFPINTSEFQTETGFRFKSSFLCLQESAARAGCAQARALH